MEYRRLGRTGLSVSELCLGAMMFGAWGNPDHDESIRIIHSALDAGINFIDTADVYSAGESEEIVGKALARAAATIRARDEGPRRDGRGPERSRATRGAGSSPSARTACAGSAPTTSTSTRSTARTRRTDIDETLGALSDLVAPGQGPLHRLLDVPGRRRSSRRSGSPSGAGASASCASSPRTRSSSAASRPTSCRVPSATAWA